MFSLDWIKAKTELVGPAHLIHEFVEYRHILDEKVYINMSYKCFKDISIWHLILGLIVGIRRIDGAKREFPYFDLWLF